MRTATPVGEAPVRQFNGLKTAVLLGLLSAIIIGAGSLFGRGGLFIGFLLALGTNAYAYWNSDKLALGDAGPPGQRGRGPGDVCDGPRAGDPGPAADAPAVRQ